LCALIEPNLKKRSRKGKVDKGQSCGMKMVKRKVTMKDGQKYLAAEMEKVKGEKEMNKNGWKILK